MSYQSAVYRALTALAVVTGAGAIGPAVAQTSVSASPSPVQLAQNVVVIARTAPPAATVETIPPPPVGSQAAYWQPGHWNWNGANWVWIAGSYVMPPRSSAIWVPGQWVVQPTGGYSWIDGHWQG